MSHSTSSPPGEPRATPPCTARDLVAVLYRQAGLIAVCALVPVALQSVFDHELPPGARQNRWRSEATGGLKLDLSPDFAIAVSGAAPLDAGPGSQALALPLRLDATRQNGLAPRLNPTPAESHVIVDAPDPATRRSKSRIVAWPGPLAGLLAGLLLAALRELGGDRMRSPREAERALGLPVLGAIPTLSAKARSAYFGPPTGAQNAAPTELA